MKGAQAGMPKLHRQLIYKLFKLWQQRLGYMQAEHVQQPAELCRRCPAVLQAVQWVCN